MSQPPRGPYSRVVDDVEEAMSIKFNTLVYELRRKGVSPIVLSLGEAYFDVPLLPLRGLPYPTILHYSHSLGIPELREKLCGYYRREFDVRADPEREILITAGSKAGIYMTLLSILDPGDEVLVPEPGWVSYTEQVKLCYGKPVGIPYDVPVHRYGEFVTRKTKALVLNTPHNPRGIVHRRSEIRHLLELAHRRGLWLLSDEAYSDFAAPGEFVSAGRLDPAKRRTVLFNSVSKGFGLSGWRIGYLIANEELIRRVLKVNQHLITCPPTILEHYVARHFERIRKAARPQIRRVMELRRRVAGYMSASGLSFLEGSGTFYFFVSIQPSTLSSEKFCERLLRESAVCVVPGIGYGRSCDGFVRLSIGTEPWGRIVEGIDRLKALIEKTRVRG